MGLLPFDNGLRVPTLPPRPLLITYATGCLDRARAAPPGPTRDESIRGRKFKIVGNSFSLCKVHFRSLVEKYPADIAPEKRKRHTFFVSRIQNYRSSCFAHPQRQHSLELEHLTPSSLRLARLSASVDSRAGREREGVLPEGLMIVRVR
jgi:hypothetical protein